MKKELFEKLLNDSLFLSLFYQSRQESEQNNIPLESSFLAKGLNKYKHWFFYLCDRWNLTNLIQIREFNAMVKVM